MDKEILKYVELMLELEHEMQSQPVFVDTRYELDFKYRYYHCGDMTWYLYFGKCFIETFEMGVVTVFLN